LSSKGRFIWPQDEIAHVSNGMLKDGDVASLQTQLQALGEHQAAADALERPIALVRKKGLFMCGCCGTTPLSRAGLLDVRRLWPRSRAWDSRQAFCAVPCEHAL
jgi:hypothetical protein